VAPRGRRQPWLIGSGLHVPLPPCGVDALMRASGRTSFPTGGFTPSCRALPTTTPPYSALLAHTVLIIDDHELVATSLTITLRSAGLQAQRHPVRSRDGVLAATATLRPGVALLDLDLGRDPDGTAIDGVTLIEGMCRTGWRVLALSGSSDESRIGEALAAGALAGISKSAALPVLLAAVRRAAQGAEVMHPERRRQLIEAHLRTADRGRTIGPTTEHAECS
jgi:DNA-binding NarL/FixJ family response regulator